MKRRLVAVILTLILLIMLCELHICSGEDCLFCAQIEEMRVCSACVFESVALLCLLLRFHFTERCIDSQRPQFKHTLIDLKVELNR